MHKRLKRSQDSQDLEHTASTLLDQARGLVAKARAQVHAEAAELCSKFPTLSKSDPRAAELLQIGKEYRRRRLRKRLRPPAVARQEEARQHVDALMLQALDLLARPP